jgi:ABC-type branched-subunit amino acid transport system permease subunit
MHFLGPVFGAFAFVLLDEVASQWSVGRCMMFGALLILVVLAFPRGVAGGFAAAATAVKRRLGA